MPTYSWRVPVLTGRFELVTVVGPGVGRLPVWAGVDNDGGRSDSVLRGTVDVAAVNEVDRLILSNVESGETEACTTGLVCSASLVVVVGLGDGGPLALARSKIEVVTGV